MSDRFWVGGSGNWNDTAHWSTTDGGASGAAAPTTSDDAYFTILSNATAYTMTMNVDGFCRTLSVAAPLTGNVTWATGTKDLTMSGGLAFYASMAISGGGQFFFGATTTGFTVNFASVAMSNRVSFNGTGGGWTLGGAASIGDQLVLFKGTLDTANYNIYCSTFDCSTSTTRSLTLGTSQVECTVSWKLTTTTGLTLSAASSTILCSGAASSFLGGGKTYGTVNMTGSGAQIVTGANTYSTFTRTGTAVTTDSLTFSANQTISGTLTLSGNSTSNRMLIASDTAGTPRTLTAATVTVINADFLDITGAGAGSWNLASITGKSGDCGGNSGITFTTPANQFWFKNTGSFSDSSKWFLATGGGGGAGRVPLPQDSAFFDASSFDTGSQTVTQDMPRIPTVTWTGATNTPTFTTTLAASVYGSFTLISGMTFTASTSLYSFDGHGAYTLTSAGKSFTRSVQTNSGTGSLTLQDAFTMGSTNILFLTSGTFDANNQTVTAGFMASTVSRTRTITMGSATWSMTGNAGTVWNTTTTTGLTLNANTSTIDCTYSGATGTRVIATGTAAVNIVKVSAGTDTFSVTACSAKDFVLTGFAGTLAGSGALTLSGILTMSTGLTRTYTGAVSFTATSGTNVITSATKTFASTFSFSGVGGTWQFADTFVTTGALTLTAGTLDASLVNVTTLSFLTTGSGTKVITLGAFTWSLTGTTTVWDALTGTNLTVTPATSVIKITDTTSTQKTFAGAGKTYYDFWYAPGAGTGTINFTGSNTFSDLKDNGSAAHSMLFTAGTTTTVASFHVVGTLSNLITIGSITAANHNLVKTGTGIVDSNFLSISRSQASPGRTWFAGQSSTDAGNNTGWIFRSAPDGDFFLMWP